VRQLTKGTQLAPLRKVIHARPSARKLKAINYQASSGPEALRATVALIGKGIREGGRYVPLIQHARRLASRAAPKDYLGQLESVYNDFVRRWRYVHDPRAVEMVAITGPEIYGQILGADFSPPDHGYGDCDDATIYLGAVAESLGLPSRIVTISPPTFTGSLKLFSHVYPEVKIPKVGWVAADAVGFPQRPFGWRPPALRRAYWDTRGNLLGYEGFFPSHFKREFKQMARADVRGLQGFDGLETAGKGFKNMGSLNGYEPEMFGDLGLENFGFAGMDGDEPLDWQQYGLLSFGAYMDRPLPMVSGDNLGWFAEYDENDYIGFAGGVPVVRTKMFEMDPKELRIALMRGRPRMGCVALGDDGDVYQWVETPGLGGFFKKLFKKVKRGVKKVAKGIKKGVRKVTKGITKGAKKLIKKLPGGKYVVKVAGKIKKVALKAAKPILKLGKKLAPIAAVIPGYGPVIAAALRKGPAALKLMQKMGVMTDSKGRPKFKNKKQARAFKQKLTQQRAKAMRGAGRRRGGRPAIMHPRMIKRGSRAYAQRLRGYGLDWYDEN